VIQTTPARLTVVDDLGAALAQLETRLLHHARLLDQTDPDVQEHGPRPGLPRVLLIDDTPTAGLREHTRTCWPSAVSPTLPGC
jgi:hypothetical protein